MSLEDTDRLAAHVECCERCERELQRLDAQGESIAMALRKESPAPSGPGHTTVLRPSNGPQVVGTMIAGRYKLVEPLGERGMGAFYMAQQVEPVVAGLFGSLPKTLGLDLDPAACIPRIDAPAARRLATDHLDRLAAIDATADRVVATMPENYRHVGLMAMLFPKARFIHCRRDLRDIAVSCWVTQFAEIEWANDPSHIAARFRDYVELMEHWRAALPVEVLEVSYEDTVADLEGEARRLVSHCGLDCEPSCLAFHQTHRPVRIASVTQVRRPIYTGSAARWRHYEPALTALFAALPEVSRRGPCHPGPTRPPEGGQGPRVSGSRTDLSSSHDT